MGEQHERLAAAGLTAGGTVALRLPPSLGYVAALLAGWQLGAQVALLDYRLTEHEVQAALARLAPQVLVRADRTGPGSLRGFSEAQPVVVPLPDGRPAATPHAVVQLSSGSTGPSKVIGRTAADLLRELDCYRRLPEFPAAGERVVLLSSTVHVLGLVGGLLHSLHTQAPLTVPERMTAAGILAAVAADDRPTTVIGVPFHAELLAGVQAPPPLPQLRRMVVAGELLRPDVPPAFAQRYGVPLGTMYGMTELGVIATDLSGRHHPSVEPVHGMELRERDGELHIRVAASPYLGDTAPDRWSDGWLHTRDAGRVDQVTGLVTVLGRRDSQVSVGGLKVDLTEVEQTLAALPGVREAVVLFADGAIEAFLCTEAQDAGTEADVLERIGERLAAYKRPRSTAFLPALPRTATGKLLRDATALHAAAAAHPAPAAR
ncbi:class I adenylate-forming enzyme family protein [Streptacidiphilus sp. PB12-B1b]|uniref:class I adenylate-forming enzyme family protein n=1 Tax=Streptacidiphilus sp. PB12-B1b TaxID=2705012 RepID=UPI001CDD3023|nr:class I adenylate-forming enzyme family protein [Streptacidiphilus sp. PB12-B1b]